jgi:hypothetical protein
MGRFFVESVKQFIEVNFNEDTKNEYQKNHFGCALTLHETSFTIK